MADDPGTARADPATDAYGSGWCAGYSLGYRRGYEAGWRDASQPTARQPTAGEVTEMRIIDTAQADQEAGDD